MKKSEIYKKAQFAVLKDEELTSVEKLEILKVLMHEEKFIRFTEEREESEVQDNG